MTNIMLIPGLNNTSETWDQVSEFLPSEWNVNAINIPAISDVNEIADLLLKNETEPFYVCGFSFGGYIALAMLDRAPELIKGFILLASTTTSDSDKQKEARKKAIARAENGEYFKMMEENTPITFHPDSLKNEEIMNLRSKIVNDYGPNLFVNHVNATIGRPDRTSIFKNSKIPKLIISGKDDKVIPAVKLLELAEATPGSTYKAVEGTGHMVPMENPKDVSSIIKEWISKN